MAIELDLKTLNLPVGTHTIQYQAMKNGKAISSLSSGVSYTVEPGPGPTPGDMPNKGDIITLDGGTSRFRVLKVSGNIVQLLSLENYQSSVFSNGTTTTFDNGSTGLKYVDSTLDTLLNTTYYNSLSTNIKNAIVEESRIQNMYSRSSGQSTSATFQMQRTNGSWYSYTKTDQTTIGNRKVYALDASDIVEYLGTSIVYQDFLTMFFETTSSISRYVWTSSAHATNSTYAWYVNGNYGYLNNYYCNNSYEVFPAFSINLSLINWQAE